MTPDERKEAFGKRIKRIRELKGLTGVYLAGICGYNSTGMWTQIEKGKTQMAANKIALAAEALQVPTAMLTDNLDEEWSDERLKTMMRAHEVSRTVPEDDLKFLNRFFDGISPPND